MEKYKKGDYIAVMTNQPDIHFLEMFGHGLSTDNVEPSEYVAKIKNVIDDDNYLIFIVHPTTYRCVVSGSEIIRKMSDDELTAEIREEEDIIEFMAPNVYENCAVLNGTNTEEKCVELSRLAMNSLFPEYQISSIEQVSSEFTKKDLLECVDALIKMNRNKDEPFEMINYDLKCYPKVNPHNIEIIEEYKKIIKENYEEYSNILLGCNIQKICEGGAT